MSAICPFLARPGCLATVALTLLVAAPLSARTMDLLDEDCERVAVISAAAPRLSWACAEWPERGVFTTNLGFPLRTGHALLICFPIEQIPKGQRVRSAELTLPVWNADGPGRITVRRILGDWGPGVCHQYRTIRPKPVEWAKPGVRGIGSDCATKPTAILNVTEKGDKTVNVFKDVEMWYNGDAANHGWIISADDQNTSLNMKSPISSYPSGRGVWKLSVEFVPE
jgi:hypothetical protein